QEHHALAQQAGKDVERPLAAAGLLHDHRHQVERSGERVLHDQRTLLAAARPCRARLNRPRYRLAAAPFPSDPIDRRYEAAFKPSSAWPAPSVSPPWLARPPPPPSPAQALRPPSRAWPAWPPPWKRPRSAHSPWRAWLRPSPAWPAWPRPSWARPPPW